VDSPRDWHPPRRKAARIPTAEAAWFSPLASVGSSHNRPTSAEDNEEASLLACPAIGLVDGGDSRTNGRKKQEASIPGLKRIVERKSRLVADH
jgi:hypothetical protein